MTRCAANLLKPPPEPADLTSTMTWSEFGAYLSIVLTVFGGSISWVLYRLWWR